MVRSLTRSSRLVQKLTNDFSYIGDRGMEGSAQVRVESGRSGIENTYSSDSRVCLLNSADLSEQLDELQAKRSASLPSQHRVKVEEKFDRLQVSRRDGEGRGLGGPSSSLADCKHRMKGQRRRCKQVRLVLYK
jgi:hypothetical protein